MTKKITPALLGDPEKPRIYRLFVDNGQGTVSMIFNQRHMAQQEYNRIKGQGSYLGHWLKHIELKDEVDQQG